MPTNRAFRGLVLLVFTLSIGRVGAQIRTCTSGYLALPSTIDSAATHPYLESIYSGRISLEEVLQEGASNGCWLVYSDRRKNPLYVKPNVLGNDTLTFMEEVAVKRVEGQWMEVYSLIQSKGGKLYHNVNRGWIHVRNILLTPYAELNTRGFPKKGMVLVSLAGLDRDAINSGQILQKKFYHQPSASAGNYLGKVARKFDIYFVLKQERDAVLLSKADRLNGGLAARSSAVMGWIPNANITDWDSRVCLEPSTRRAAVDQYADREIPVYDDKPGLQTLLRTQLYSKSKSVFRVYRLSSEKIDAYEMRMPILNPEPEGIQYVASIARLTEKDDLEKSESLVKRKLQETKDKLAHVNILFAVDGTQSMKDYYPAVATAIQEIIRNNELQRFNNALRFGLVVYRDYADGGRMFEITHLTSDHESVAFKAKTTQCFSADRDLPEAQYQGLIKGMQQAGLDSTHSNLVVLIGDAGNHRNDRQYTSTQVVHLLREMQCSLVSFQVVNGSDNSFLDFNYDVQDFLRKAGARYVADPKRVKLRAIGVENTYELQFMNYSGEGETDYYMVGRFTYASGSRAMDVNILERNVVEAVNEYLLRVETIRAKFEGVTDHGAKFEPEFIDLLRLKGFTEREIEILKQVGEISAKGYTATRFYGNNTECFVPVVFMSLNEKAQVNEMLGKMINSGGGGTATKQLFMQAVQRQAMSLTGEKSPEVVAGKTLDEIWRDILGIPFSGTHGRIPLRDLNKMEDSKFGTFYTQFKAKALQFIDNSYPSRMMKLGNTSYYWIPLEDFPGN